MSNKPADTRIEKIIAQACTDAIAAVCPPGKYPLDTAIITEAHQAIKDLIAEQVAAARIDENELWVLFAEMEHQIEVVDIKNRIAELEALKDKGEL